MTTQKKKSKTNNKHLTEKSDAKPEFGKYLENRRRTSTHVRMAACEERH